MSRREKHNQYDVNIKRLLYIKVISFTILFALVIRLFYIQIVGHDFYTSEVSKQRQISIPINSGRGIIYDRNFIPLTDRIDQKTVIVLTQHFNVTAENILLLEDLTSNSYEDLVNKIETSTNSLEFPLVNDIEWNDKKVINTKGLFIINKKIRHEDGGVLNHIIGYINKVDYRGMSGLERAYDGILSGNPSESFVATIDGRKRLLPGEQFAVVNSNKKTQNLRLTIDYNIQNIVENVIDESKKNGAIIISDIKTGEILALTSRPNFNPNNIMEHLNSNGDELYNKAIQMTFPPGSIFKIIVAIEALKDGIVYDEEIFYCKGYESFDGFDIKCSSYEKGGHGEINMEEAFAQSCNCVFIQLTERIGTKKIINMAEELGFDNIINIGLEEENAGYLPQGDELLGPAFGNIAIGQGPILVTPLQVNQMTQIISNDGLKKGLYIIEDIVDSKFGTIKRSYRQEDKQVIDPIIAKTIQYLMKKVMTDGTGREAKEFSSMTAGKTGSAEAIDKGVKTVHAWFTGYYPSDDPQYAITVFIQNGKSGGSISVPIFTKILEKMLSEGY